MDKFCLGNKKNYSVCASFGISCSLCLEFRLCNYSDAQRIISNSITGSVWGGVCAGTLDTQTHTYSESRDREREQEELFFFGATIKKLGSILL